MQTTVRNALAPAPSRDYESLPEFLKAKLSLKEYLWLGDAEKARLVQEETEPEV